MILELLFAAGAAIFGIAGGIRVEDARLRFNTAVADYHSLVSKANRAQATLQSELTKVGERIVNACNLLRKSNKILAPLDGITPGVQVNPSYGTSALAVFNQSSLMLTVYSKLHVAAAGVGVGTLVAAGSWGAVSLLGTASTGTAIATLHGAAATHATLAWLGGGSLAGGGAGILGGKLALGGVVLLPAAFAFGIASHLKANEINTQADEVEAANAKNRVALQQMSSQLAAIQPLYPVLDQEIADLKSAYRNSHKALFPVPGFSRLRKRLRLFFRGYYYNQADMVWVETLGAAVDKFLKRFCKDCSPVSSNARILEGKRVEPRPRTIAPSILGLNG